MVTSNVVTTKKRKVAFTETLAPRPRTQTELARRNRSLSFSDASIAVEWLNAIKKESRAYKNVIVIRAEMEYLSQMPADTKSAAEFRMRANLLNEHLSCYSFIPVLACDPANRKWSYNAVPKAMHAPIVKVSDGHLTVPVNEAVVVASLARLFANRQLYKVRLCEQCHERWRVSEREMDRFCSDQCRETWHTQSPEYSERRCEITRRYRENLKAKIAASDAYSLSKKGRK